jgi:hypothetical protein
VQGAAGFDSLALTVSAGATAEHFVPLHMYAIASVAIVYTHFRAQLFNDQQGKDFFRALQLLTNGGTWARQKKRSPHASHRSNRRPQKSFL